jgi:arylsulfatase A-like enzyme
MPHVPIFCSPEFEGKSGMGLYGDVLLELDWSVGAINQALKDHGLEENTIVILTSDNGPWIAYGNHAGSTPFREAKATSFDGGIRSACIVKYPPEIAAGATSSETFFSIDLLPTLCHLAGIGLPAHEIDGKNVWDLVRGVPGAGNPNAYYAISTGPNLESIMSGDGTWKLHLNHRYRTLKVPGADGLPGKYVQVEIDTSLFNMDTDPYETENLITEYPEIARTLTEYAKMHTRRFYRDGE